MSEHKPAGNEKAGSNPDRERFERMTVSELRVYADQHYKLTFEAGVTREGMIAAILEREKG